MGTKRSIKHLTNNNEENLSVPPGFVSLTSLALKRVVTGWEAADPVNVGGEFRSGLTGASLSNFEVKKFKTSFTQKPWICHDQLDRAPQKFDFEQTEIHKKDPVDACIPKGVSRGCANCHDCLTVTARRHPKESRFPELEDAPVFQPMEEEFKDTLNYIAKICPRAENYGICRIVPPSSWRPPCLLEDKKTWEASKFSTHVQQVGLQNLYLKRKQHMGTEMPRHAVGLERESGDESVVTSESESGPEFTLKNFKKYADDFKRQYFCQNPKLKDLDTSTSAVQDLRGPLIAQIEGEYWRIIENTSEKIEVLCGSDSGNRTLGGGFPITAIPTKTMTEYSDYVESGWNLNNIPQLPGSLLPFGCEGTSAILDPQLFIGMCFASQWWRNEHHHVYSLSYMHLGDLKVWYSVPGRYCFRFVEVVKKLSPQLLEHPQLLHELVTQLSPTMLMSEGIPVYRCVQNPMEFVLIFPGAYHSNFSCGFNCSEAVCFAPFDWLPHGQNIVELYAEYRLKTLISHDRMLLEAAMEAVNAHWEAFAMKKDSSNNQLWTNVFGKDGILTRVLKSRIKNESIRRKHLCNQLLARPFDEFDVAVKRECCICLYDLYLSAVGCSCSPNKYSCLRHAKQLCSCAWDAKVFYFRYSIVELNLLVKALEGNRKAVRSWAKRKAQPDASQQLNPGDKSPAYEMNLIADNDVMPAFGRSVAANAEHETTTTTSSRPDTGLQNSKHQPASSLNALLAGPLSPCIGSGQVGSSEASGRSDGANEEHETTTTTFPCPDTGLQNAKHRSASNLRVPVGPSSPRIGSAQVDTINASLSGEAQTPDVPFSGKVFLRPEGSSGTAGIMARGRRRGRGRGLPTGRGKHMSGAGSSHGSLAAASDHVYPRAATSPSLAAGPSTSFGTSEPTTPLILESLSGTGPGSLCGRKRVRIENERFIDSHEMAARITHIFQENLVAEGHVWRHVPKPVRDGYFYEFKKYYWWDELEEQLVRMVWDQRASRRYGDMLYKWRQRGRPVSCSEEVWNAWQRAWNVESFRTVSARQRGNRMSETGGPGSGPSRHTCGSRSIDDHFRAIEKAEGVAPGRIQLFNKTHMTKTDDRQEVYVDEKARIAGERMNERLSQAIIDDNGNLVQPTPELEERIFMQTVSELSQGRRYLYGTGTNREHNFYSDASTSAVSPSTIDPQQFQELQKATTHFVEQLQEKDARIQHLESTIQDKIDNRVRQLVAELTQSIRGFVSSTSRDPPPSDPPAEDPPSRQY